MEVESRFTLSFILSILMKMLQSLDLYSNLAKNHYRIPSCMEPQSSFLQLGDFGYSSKHAFHLCGNLFELLGKAYAESLLAIQKNRETMHAMFVTPNGQIYTEQTHVHADGKPYQHLEIRFGEGPGTLIHCRNITSEHLIIHNEVSEILDRKIAIGGWKQQYQIVQKKAVAAETYFAHTTGVTGGVVSLEAQIDAPLLEIAATAYRPVYASCAGVDLLCWNSPLFELPIFQLGSL